jgi:hypothetical protein
VATDQLSHPNNDDRAIAALPGVVASFRNTAHWYNNASFLLPLSATLAVGALGALRHSGELLGFATFLAVVTLAMVPVVLYGWHQTATAVVLTGQGVVSLHGGRVLKSFEWRRVTGVHERETQGNRRWEIATNDGERLLLDGELEDLERLIALAQQLAHQRGGKSP